MSTAPQSRRLADILQAGYQRIWRADNRWRSLHRFGKTEKASETDCGLIRVAVGAAARACAVTFSPLSLRVSFSISRGAPGAKRKEDLRGRPLAAVISNSKRQSQGKNEPEPSNVAVMDIGLWRGERSF